MHKVTLCVRHEDALAIKADVLALKHAQATYGVDATVAALFAKAGRPVQLPKVWGFRLDRAPKGVSSRKVLFVGVPSLREFGYREIRTFARQVMTSRRDRPTGSPG